MNNVDSYEQGFVHHVHIEQATLLTPMNKTEKLYTLANNITPNTVHIYQSFIKTMKTEMP